MGKWIRVCFLTPGDGPLKLLPDEQQEPKNAAALHHHRRLQRERLTVAGWACRGAFKSASRLSSTAGPGGGSLLVVECCSSAVFLRRLASVRVDP